MKKEFEYEGISFYEGTPEKVCRILKNLIHTGKRIRVFYGDKETGTDWIEEHDTVGYIGKSTGIKPITLMIHDSRCIGGGAILTSSIVKITQDHRILYQHDSYNIKSIVTKDNQVFTGGELYANCKNPVQAARLAMFLRGERNSK